MVESRASFTQASTAGWTSQTTAQTRCASAGRGDDCNSQRSRTDAALIIYSKCTAILCSGSQPMVLISKPIPSGKARMSQRDSETASTVPHDNIVLTGARLLRHWWVSTVVFQCYATDSYEGCSAFQSPSSSPLPSSIKPFVDRRGGKLGLL